jgi:AcrR family transcriptional regulator
MGNPTKERILDAAEALFGSGGFAGTSLRELTRAAGVNLAAVHYHFGSKEALLAAVLDRRVAPVNLERLRRLGALEEKPEPPDVEAILETLLQPALAMEGRPELRPILGRLHSEPVELIGPILDQQFGEIERRFTGALARALPELPAEELRARFQLVVGAMIHVLSGTAQAAPGGAGGLEGEGGVRHMVAFLAAGMRAPQARGAVSAAAAGAGR